MRQILGEKLNCTLIEEKFIIDQSVFIAKPNKENKKYFYGVQGLLGSKLISTYFKYSSNEFDALFPKIKIGEFKELPIFKDLSSANTLLEPIVKKILLIKKEQSICRNQKLEKEIDDIVK
ncbi:MAG: hypothetical protein IPF75_05445 [Bacteroidetes bacterium]|nr:hypothetical protein [Bacteroidota bacterium]